MKRMGHKNRRAGADAVQSAADVSGEFRKATADAARHSEWLYLCGFRFWTGNFEKYHCVYWNILN